MNSCDLCQSSRCLGSENAKGLWHILLGTGLARTVGTCAISRRRRQDQHAAVTVLDVGRMNQRMKQQPYRVDEDVALLALDLLARIIPARIDANPPFSALLTLWLSMMQAVGLASRSIASRHFT